MNINLVPTWVYWIVIAILLAAVGGQQVRLSKEQAAHAETKTANAVVLRDISEKTTKAAGLALAAQKAFGPLVAAIDSQSKERDHALAENSTLRDRVRAGERRLRIRAIVPACVGSPDVPASTIATGVDAETTVELAPSAGSTVLDIRAGIIADQTALKALQTYVRDVCPGP
jgi:prophage endopeptidase